MSYRVGNLTASRPYFGWVELKNSNGHGFLLRPNPGVVENWINTPSGWQEALYGTFLEYWPNLREDLMDPHHVLESILRYTDLTSADMSLEPDGRARLNFEVDPSSIPILSFAEELQAVLFVDQESFEISQYRTEWTLKDGSCRTFVVEAKDGQYDIDFQIPDVVRQGSDIVNDCIDETLGVLIGTARRSGAWVRECGRDLGEEGYSRPYRFSLDDWAFVRMEVLSADDVSLNLLSGDGSDPRRINLEAEDYLVAQRGIEVLETDRLLWTHGAIPPGEYTAEVITHNRALPGGFTFTINAQPIPPPPYRFTTIDVGGQQSCGLLSDGTPICWGRRIWYRGLEAWPPTGEKFVSISVGTHACGLREDGTAVCWGFRDEGKHTCRIQEDGGRFCRLDDQDAPWEPPPSRLSGSFSVSAYIKIIQGYFDQTPPPDERFESISVGGGVTCAIREDGTPLCWGRTSLTPDDERFSAISTGDNHTCGIRLDGTAICWGDNTYKQLSVPEDETFIAISAGEQHTCALRADGTTSCWGDGDRPDCKLNPHLVYSCGPSAGLGEFNPPSPPERERFASISPEGGTCALRPDKTPMCWTPYIISGLTAPPEGERFTSVAGNLENACGLREDGRVICWGLDRTGGASPPDGMMWAETQ